MAQSTGNKLEDWKKRLEESAQAWDGKVSDMDSREKIYNGEKAITPIIQNDDVKETTHVRNIVYENIESQVSADIVQPKVIARNPKNERLAAIVEHWLRNELVRQRFEKLNDQAERTVPIQGGVCWHEEWDNTRGGHGEAGQLVTTLVHPKLLAPQPGVLTDIDDMDWVIIKIPTTKEKIKRIYDKDVQDESESEADLRGTGQEDKSEDIVTQHIGYSRNENGGIDKYVWVNDIELEDLENYQARRLPRCAKCGRVRPLRGQVISHAVETNLNGDPAADAAQAQQAAAAQAIAGDLAGQEMAGDQTGGNQKIQENANLLMQGVNMLKGAEPPETYEDGPCPWCGGNEWIDEEIEYEPVYIPIKTAMGNEIPGATATVDPETQERGLQPTLIPFYRPNIYPVVLQKNTSVFGQLLGASDVDVIKSQQNTTNRIEMKIIKRLLDAGTIVTLPNKPGIQFDSRDNKKLYINDASDKACIGTYSFTGDLHYELAYLSQVYEEARQILGITDSFQGRKDTTATSARAKEFSANMSAGRLQSKRVMKKEAYARLFELMFKFQLAYADEPRFVSYRDEKTGNVVYEEFNRYDFVEQDPTTGEWYWNDDFIFSVDTSAPLANNQEAMWQETRMNFSEGTFGDPTQIETQILFWSMMEILHYPWAGSTKKALEARLKQQQEMAAAGPGMMPGAGPEMAPPPGGPPMPDMAPPMPGGPVPPAPPMADPTMGMPL